MLKDTSRRRTSSDDRAVVGAVGVGRVAADVLARSALSRIDYVDHFTLAHHTAVRATPEQWARALFGDAPDLIERLLWSGILGLRLQTGVSPRTVAGWTITGYGQGWLRTSAASRDASAELIVQAKEGVLGLATLVRYDRRRAPLIWTPVSFVHRRLVPVLLRSTVRSLSGRTR